MSCNLKILFRDFLCLFVPLFHLHISDRITEYSGIFQIELPNIQVYFAIIKKLDVKQYHGSFFTGKKIWKFNYLFSSFLLASFLSFFLPFFLPFFLSFFLSFAE